MAGILDRAKSKLFGQKAVKKNKDGRCRSNSSAATLPLSGHTFTTRLMRPEMRQLHKERMRQDSDTTSTGSSEIDSDVASSYQRHFEPARSTTDRRRRSWRNGDSVLTNTRPAISRRQSDSDAVILRQPAPSRCYRVEVSHSVCLDEVNALNSEDEDSLVVELDRMQAELGKKKLGLESCLKRDSTASGSDGDSGIGGILTSRSDARDNASSSPHPCDKLEQPSRRKTVRFRFDNCQRDNVDSELEEGSLDNDDYLSSVSEESSNDDELETDEEYLGRI